MKEDRSAEYTSIMRLLPTLERGELELLRSRIGALLHLSPEAPDIQPMKVHTVAEPYIADPETMVLGAISEVLFGLGVEYVEVSTLRTRSPGMAAFRKKLPGVMKYIAYACKMKNHQRALLCIGIDLLYKDMERMGLPITGRNVMQQIHRVPAILNAAFPGYSAAGHLEMILREEKSK